MIGQRGNLPDSRYPGTLCRINPEYLDDLLINPVPQDIAQCFPVLRECLSQPACKNRLAVHD
jgi:hypothetical protein